MALNLSPWRPPAHQPLPSAPEYKFTQPDVASLLQEGIAGIGKAFFNQYEKSQTARFREDAAEAARRGYGAQAAGLGAAYGPGAQPYGPNIPPGGIPAALTTENPTAVNLKPHEAGLLNAIALKESGGKYNIRYTPGGGTTFEGFDKHPGIFEKGPAGPSSAAGRYQFTKTTWEDVMGANTPFTPENQDIAALRLARRDYNAKTGRDLDTDLQSEGFSARIQGVLKPRWAALGGKNADAISGAYSSTAGGWKAPEVTTVQLPSQPQGPGARPYAGPSGRTILREDVANPPVGAPIRTPTEGPNAATAAAPRDGRVQVASADNSGVFQAEGLNVRPVYQPGQTFGRQATAEAQPFSGIVLHHTATQDLDSALNISRGDPNRGGTPYGYHFYVDRDGSIVQGAPLDARTNHTLPGQGYTNANSIGISLVGNSQDATPQQIAAATQLARSLQGRFNIAPDRIAGHGQIRGEKQADEGAPVLANLRGGSGGAPAGGGGAVAGAPGGFSAEGLQAALAQAPPVLQQAIQALAARVPGGMQAILGQLAGQLGGTQAGGQPGGQAPTPAAARAPAAVAQAAPGVVARTPPTEQATATGQHQAPLFQTPQLASAEAAATIPGGTMPGTMSDASPEPLPAAPGTQTAGLVIEPQPPTPPRRPPPPPAGGGGGGPAPPAPPIPPPRPAAEPPPRSAVAAPAAAAAPPRPPFRPTGGDSTYAATEDYRRAVEAGLITPEGQMRLDASPAAAPGGPAGPGGPGAPPAAGRPRAAPAGAPAAQGNPWGDFIYAAIRSGDPHLITMANGLLGGKNGDWKVTHDSNGNWVRYNERTGDVQPLDIGGGQQGGNDIILPPNDPRRAQHPGIPNDNRTYRAHLGPRGWEYTPADERESKAFEHEQNLRKEFETDPQVKAYYEARNAYGQMIESANIGNGVSDVALIYQYMKMLDPGSVVREGEFALAGQTQNVPDQVVGLYNRLVSGERLSDKQRSQYVDTAGRLLQSRHGAMERRAGYFGRIAQGSNIKPEYVTGGVEKFEHQPWKPPEGRQDPGGKDELRGQGRSAKTAIKFKDQSEYARNARYLSPGMWVQIGTEDPQQVLED